MHKRAVTTVLTIGGVLVAGSAAALVNSSILDRAPSAMVVGRDVGPEGTDPLTVSSDSVPVTGTSIPTAPVSLSETTAIYSAGECGTVTIELLDDELRIVAIDPSIGWKVVGTDDGDEVRVVFRSSVSETTFRATLLYGVVSTSLQTRSLGAAPGGGSGGGGSGGGGGGSDDSVDDGSDGSDDTEDSEPEDSEPEDSEPEDTEVHDDSVDDTVGDDSFDD